MQHVESLMIKFVRICLLLITFFMPPLISRLSSAVLSSALPRVPHLSLLVQLPSWSPECVDVLPIHMKTTGTELCICVACSSVINASSCDSLVSEAISEFPKEGTADGDVCKLRLLLLLMFQSQASNEGRGQWADGIKAWASMVVYVCMYVLLVFIQTPKHTNVDAGTASQSSV